MMCLRSWAFPCRAGLYAAIFLQKAKRISAAIPNAWDAFFYAALPVLLFILLRKLLLLFSPADFCQTLAPAERYLNSHKFS